MGGGTLGFAMRDHENHTADPQDTTSPGQSSFPESSASLQTGPAVLERFSPATRAWFTSSFSAPTPAQTGAWDSISSGQHTLVVAPTGSGKTLSAFLWALDRLASKPPPD